MFYQKYYDSTTIPESRMPSVEKMDANKAYYLDTPPTEATGPYIVKSINGSYEIPITQEVVYNPLPEAIIENYSGNIYYIENILTDEVVSKIHMEISEKNKINEMVSFNSLFINNDKIHGYNIGSKEGEHIYSFETIDDVSTKIRYLGIITPNGLSEGEFIILNYYTND